MWKRNGKKIRYGMVEGVKKKKRFKGDLAQD